MNLFLVIQEFENQHLLLPKVLEEFRLLDTARSYRSRLIHDYAPNLKHRIWALGQPTVVVSMEPLTRFLPRWATIWSQQRIDKIEEYRILEQAGIPVPKWVALRKNETPDLAAFERFVVVKPALGGLGAWVRIVRKSRVHWRPREIRRMGITSDAMIVQEYIHTGPWPVSYRVGTVFGEPVYALKLEANHARSPIEYDADQEDFDGATIVSSSKGCIIDTEIPDEVIGFARQAHRAFPTIPLLGVDIVREEATGKLYVLEVNAGGATFHLTSPEGDRVKREFGIDLNRQFGGVRAVARGLYERLNQFDSYAAVIAKQSDTKCHPRESGDPKSGFPLNPQGDCFAEACGNDRTAASQ